MKIFLIVAVLLNLSVENEAQPQKIFLGLAQFNASNCEGKYSGDYTRVRRFTTDQACSTQATSTYLIQCNSTGQISANTFQQLALFPQPAGANFIGDTLSLISSGPLQGLFVFGRASRPDFRYLKKCSSVLAKLTAFSDSPVIMFAEKLDLNIFLSPKGGFEAFKKNAVTICKGTTNYV